MRDDRYEAYDDGQAQPYQGGWNEGGADYAPAENEYQGGTQGDARARGARVDAGRAAERPGAPQGLRSARTSAPRQRSQAQNAASNAGNAVLGGLKAAGSAVAGAFGNAAHAVSSRAAQVRAVEYEEGDYVGSGAPCRVCGRPVDHLQARCPHCGALARPLYQRSTFWIAVVVLVALVVVLTLAIGSCKANQPAAPGAPAGVSATDDLQKLVDTAEASLTEQRNSHPYTRYTAYNLRQAVTAAEKVIADTSATSDARSEAAAGLTNAQAALLTLASDYEWPVFGENLLDSPATWSTKQVALNCNVVSVEVAADGGLSSMVIADPNDEANQLTVYFYTVDITNTFDVGSNVNVYGEFVYDGTNMALWADKVEVL